LAWKPARQRFTRQKAKKPQSSSQEDQEKKPRCWKNIEDKEIARRRVHPAWVLSGDTGSQTLPTITLPDLANLVAFQKATKMTQLDQKREERKLYYEELYRAELARKCVTEEMRLGLQLSFRIRTTMKLEALMAAWP
jgi:hypothetical protein